jgi:hypothetical protein
LGLCAPSATGISATTAAAATPPKLTFWKTIVIETLIADGVAVGTEHRERLLKDEWWRLALCDRGIENVEAILVQIDGDIRA